MVFTLRDLGSITKFFLKQIYEYRGNSGTEVKSNIGLNELNALLCKVYLGVSALLLKNNKSLLVKLFKFSYNYIPVNQLP